MNAEPVDALTSLLGSRARAGLLHVLIDQPDVSWSVRGAADEAGLDPKSAWLEMRKLQGLSLVDVSGSGRSRRYRWNRAHPAAAFLERLVSEMGALGVSRIVRAHLARVDGIEQAILYGSWCRGTHHGLSDVDLLVVGDVDDETLHREMESLERQLARDVDYRKYSSDEYHRLSEQGHGFVASVLAGPHAIVKRAA